MSGDAKFNLALAVLFIIFLVTVRLVTGRWPWVCPPQAPVPMATLEGLQAAQDAGKEAFLDYLDSHDLSDIWDKI